MQHEMIEAMAEFALTVQSLVKDGWEFTMEYGERRMSINPRLIAKKGDKVVACSSVGELEDLSNIIYRQWEEQQEWYRE